MFFSAFRTRNRVRATGPKAHEVFAMNLKLDATVVRE